MNSVRVVADSGCDLPPDVAARYGITIVPLNVRFGEEVISDANLSPAAFWQRARASAQIPGTAAAPPGDFLKAFRPLIAAGHDIVCLTLPGRYSATFNSAWAAAQEFDQRIRVVNSGSITLGMGLQALAAAKEGLAGRGLDAVQRSAESLRSRVAVIFVLDTLEWVRRGGRLDLIMPLIERVARTFQVKPVVEMRNGELHLLGVSRTYRNAVARIEDEVRSRLPAQALAAVYTVGRDVAEDLAGRLGRLIDAPPGEVMLQEAGAVFGVHAGPNALGAVVVRA